MIFQDAGHAVAESLLYESHIFCANLPKLPCSSMAQCGSPITEAQVDVAWKAQHSLTTRLHHPRYFEVKIRITIALETALLVRDRRDIHMHIWRANHILVTAITLIYD